MKGHHQKYDDICPSNQKERSSQDPCGRQNEGSITVLKVGCQIVCGVVKHIFIEDKDKLIWLVLIIVINSIVDDLNLYLGPGDIFFYCDFELDGGIVLRN